MGMVTRAVVVTVVYQGGVVGVRVAMVEKEGKVGFALMALG